jgi:hypothetical protein
MDSLLSACCGITVCQTDLQEADSIESQSRPDRRIIPRSPPPLPETVDDSRDDPTQESPELSGRRSNPRLMISSTRARNGLIGIESALERTGNFRSSEGTMGKEKDVKKEEKKKPKKSLMEKRAEKKAKKSA